jgi:uncharacterized membrane protein affecting hemolysin expression
VLGTARLCHNTHVHKQIENIMMLDIVIRITSKGIDAATENLAILLSIAAVIGVGFAIFLNTKRGQKWIDNL